MNDAELSLVSFVDAPHGLFRHEIPSPPTVAETPPKGSVGSCAGGCPNPPMSVDQPRVNGGPS